MNNRLPQEYFITKGAGSSAYTSHAGAFHIALYEAGISDYNIMTYSSVIPATAKEVINKNDMPFGSELMTIMACANGREGEFISAGIVIGDLYDNKKKIGSLVCAIGGSYKLNELDEKLDIVINDLYNRTYSQYELRNIRHITNSYIVEDVFGTVLCAICFVSFK